MPRAEPLRRQPINDGHRLGGQVGRRHKESATSNHTDGRYGRQGDNFTDIGMNMLPIISRRANARARRSDLPVLYASQIRRPGVQDADERRSTNANSNHSIETPSRKSSD